MQGKGVSAGVTKGPLYFFRRQDTTVVKSYVEDTEAEKARLHQAQEKAIAQLEAENPIAPVKEMLEFCKNTQRGIASVRCKNSDSDEE